MAPPECLQQGVRDCVGSTVWAPSQRWQYVPSDPALGRAPQALHLGVRGIRPEPDARDASAACRLDRNRAVRPMVPNPN
jgi:hypothetical protein